MSFNADELSVSKEISMKELRALSHAIDETLLFARISAKASGEKFVGIEIDLVHKKKFKGYAWVLGYS